VASQGPLSPSTGANDNSYGTVAWNSEGSIVASDNTPATAILAPAEVSNYLKATGFSFSIPAGATIDGIVVGIERHENVSSANAFDDRVDDRERHDPVAQQSELFGVADH
jgi:hypothetical protein